MQLSDGDQLGVPTEPSTKRRGLDHQPERWTAEHHGSIFPHKLLLVLIHEHCGACTAKPPYPTPQQRHEYGAYFLIFNLKKENCQGLDYGRDWSLDFYLPVRLDSPATIPFGRVDNLQKKRCVEFPHSWISVVAVVRVVFSCNYLGIKLFFILLFIVLCCAYC